MHPALTRPVRRHLGDEALTPAMQAVLDAASAALDDMQRDRTMSARTMDALSLELEERFEKLRDSERSERESTARFQTFFDYAGIAIQVLTVDGLITHANPACRDIFGYTPDEMVGRNIASFLAGDDESAITAACIDLLTLSRESVTLEQRFEHKDGTIVWGQLTVARVLASGESRLMVMLQDVTERKRMEEELVRRAFQDDLTGLANRALFHDRLRHALERRSRTRTTVAVLLLDLDGFKRVNDSLGHAAGDQLLRAVASRISSTVRSGETVARLGGDEFAIVIEAVQTTEEVQLLAERLLRIISKPVIVVDREVVVNVSIGIAIAQSGDEGDALLRNADVAMYSAKNAGKQCARLFDSSMLERAQSWLELEQALRRAVERMEFELLFQPMMDLREGTLLGFEALLRWRHPTRGLVAPAEFLAVAEETGVIVPIGRWALREACCYAAGWADRAGVTPSISVNLAPRQIDDPHLYDDVQAALTASGLDPKLLILEISESQMIRAPDTSHATLQAIRALGVRIAIDDFGTGYSSLSHLQFFPVDELKIDSTFVSRMDEGDREASFVRTMLALANSLGVNVVAEGIEREAQQVLLTALGCSSGQGFLFSRPLAINDVLNYIATHEQASDARANDQRKVAIASSGLRSIDGTVTPSAG